jgi:arylsulfatase A-like enzyme
MMQLLAEAGYQTHAVGKMHFLGLHYGLRCHERMEEGIRYRVDDDYLMFLKANGVRTRYPQGLRDLLYLQPQTSGIAEKYAQSTWVADRSINFLREHTRGRPGRPFFLWTSWTAPHPPYAPCEPYDTMYEPARMPLPVYADRPLTTLPSPAWSERARLDGAHLDAARIRRIRALYYGQISHLDRGVGRILAELERLGLANDTVVVFAADHGDMLGDHGLSQKSVPYEPSVHIPMLLRWPGRSKSGRVCHDLVGLTDLAPTLIREIGLEYPAWAPPLPGESLLSAAGGGLASGRDAFFSDYGHGQGRWVSARTPTHKYALWAAGGYEELYDLRADAWEREHGFRESFDGAGFRVYPEPAPPAEMPRNVSVNEGRWPETLPADERDTVETYARAFTRAIGKETSLTPDKLSIKIYKERGGTPLIGTPWEEAWRTAGA